MKTPVVVVNFKTFRESTGKGALRLAKICEEVAKMTGKAVAIAPSMVELALIAQDSSIPVLAQHVDNLPAGSFTGWTPVETLKATGAQGALINHSERQLELSNVEALVGKCRAFSLVSIVCADNLPIARAMAALGPDFVAVEPPELIGGDVSVTTADPQVIRGTVEEVKRMNPRVKVLCGAGVKTGEDVAKAVALGTEGVLLSTGVVKAADPKAALLDLVGGLPGA